MNKIKLFFWRLTHRKLIRQLRNQVKCQIFQEIHPLSSKKFKDEFKTQYFNEAFNGQK